MISDEAYTRLSTSLPAGALRVFGKLNVPLYRLSAGRLGGKMGRAPILLLTTTGRRSGQKRTAPVLYVSEGDRFVVIGSNAGHTNEPAWSLNLKANPEAEVQVGGRRHRLRARIADGDERSELWNKMNAQYGGFDVYDARTGRDIAVFVLEPAERG